MKILTDSREQLPIFKRGTTKVCLSEGDYTTSLLEPHLTIERKSACDLYSTLTSGHSRFKKEILRCESKSKQMVIAVECTKQDFLKGDWLPPKLKYSPGKYKKISTCIKILDTILLKYPHVSLRWLNGRSAMKKFILLQFIESESELLLLPEK